MDANTAGILGLGSKTSNRAPVATRECGVKQSIIATSKLKHGEKGVTMPNFSSPFSGLASSRRLSHEELVRAIRFMVAAEYEAVQLYMQLAESTDNKLAVEVLKDIANEERVHAGEFLRLLRELSPDEEEFYDEGAAEVEGEIKKLG